MVTGARVTRDAGPGQADNCLASDYSEMEMALSPTLNLDIHFHKFIKLIHFVERGQTGHFIWVYKFVIYTGG